MAMRSSDGGSVNEFVVLFVEHLVQWQEPMSAVEQPMHKMEHHVFSDDHEEKLLAQIPAVWDVFWQVQPWNLVIIPPHDYSAEDHDYKNIVEENLLKSSLSFIFKSFWIGIPRPRHILIDFVLLEEGKLVMVDEPEYGVEHNYQKDRLSYYTKEVKL